MGNVEMVVFFLLIVKWNSIFSLQAKIWALICVCSLTMYQPSARITIPIPRCPLAKSTAASQLALSHPTLGAFHFVWALVN
jgi:hypothetical protein